MFRTAGIIAGVVILAGITFAAFALIDVDVDGEVEMPEIKGGEVPEVDVDAADVDVETRKVDVPTPDIEVDMKESEVDVPVLDVDQPDAASDEKERSPELNEGEGEADPDSER